MFFYLFEQAGGRLLAVPDLFQPPITARRHGTLRAIAAVDLDLDALSPSFVGEIGEQGYAVLDGVDLATVNAALDDADRSRAEATCA